MSAFAAGKGVMPEGHREWVESPIRILHVEDSDVDALVMSDAFQNSPFAAFCIERAASLGEALDRLERSVDPFGVVLLDLNLPDSRGLATFQRISQKARGVPIVIMTSVKDESTALTAVKAGAQDFIRKSGDAEAVIRAVRYAIERHRLRADLEHANGRLRELDRLKDQFVATASHELRTPIAVVKGAVENVLDGLLGDINDGQRESLEIALDHSTKLIVLVEKLLDVARIDAGTLHLELQGVDLREIVRSSISRLKPIFDPKRIEIGLDLPGHPIEAVLDVDRIVDVMTNLLANASRFARKKVAVVLRESGGTVMIGVEDDGPGIPESGISQVFDRFVKIPEHAGRTGSGLGLSIVRGIVEAHGGAIHVENRSEGGANFMVMLPKKGPEK